MAADIVHPPGASSVYAATGAAQLAVAVQRSADAFAALTNAQATLGAAKLGVPGAGSVDGASLAVGAAQRELTAANDLQQGILAQAWTANPVSAQDITFSASMQANISGLSSLITAPNLSLNPPQVVLGDAVTYGPKPLPYAARLADNPSRAPKGIFAEYPVSTPKYTLGGVRSDNGFIDTLARLYIDVNAKERDTLIKSIAKSGQYGEETRAVVERMVSSAGYVEFLLQRASHPQSEKVDVVETVADNFVAYFFGRAAPVFSYSGVVINSHEDQQALNLFRAYWDFLRGSELARRRKRVTLAYDSYLVTGAMMNLQQDLSAENEMVMSFSFNLLASSVRTRTFTSNAWGLADSVNMLGPLSSAPADTAITDALLSSAKTTGVVAAVPAAIASGPPSTSAPVAADAALVGNAAIYNPMWSQAQRDAYVQAQQADHAKPLAKV